MALKVFTTLGGQKITLFPGFHPFGHHLQVQALGQLNDDACDRCVVWVAQDVGHKAFVDLELTQRQAFETRQRGITDAKIVNGQCDPERPEPTHFLNRDLHAVGQQALGQLELELRRSDAGLLDCLQHQIDKVRVTELMHADVDRNAQVSSR